MNRLVGAICPVLGNDMTDKMKNEHKTAITLVI